MAVVSQQIAVSTTAVLLSADADRGGASLRIVAPAAATLYIGGSGVTSTNGFPIAQGVSFGPVELAGPNDQVWGVLSTGTGTVQVLQVNA